MFDKCPGSGLVKTPTIKLKKCPQCGETIEMFSNELQTNCPKCGLAVFDDIASCVQWCKWAEECVGPEMVAKLRKQNPGNPPAKPEVTNKPN
jgi:predicted  nucleic acid-binding Zn-ribbon protein